MASEPTVHVETARRTRQHLIRALVICVLAAAAAQAQYVEKFDSWTASASSAWQTQDLAGAPFNVPANAVVEIVIRNESIIFPTSAGVRAVGSTLERRFTLHRAEGDAFEFDAGDEVVVMHVQTDAGSDIQHYTSISGSTTFTLIGYWDTGTYVERFDSFTAGANASWQDVNLCTYGVGPDHVAEIVITNDDEGDELEGGVRTDGSALERRVDIHEAEGTVVDAATMMVKAGTTISATIEVYAEVDANIDFTLVGYWSVAPGAYTELFTNVGSPAMDNTWTDRDLTANGVPDDAVAEFLLSNELADDENNIGVRANGSALGRQIELHEAESGGGDWVRMHVLTDGGAVIEQIHEDVSDAHSFDLIGYWTTCDPTNDYLIEDLGVLTGGNDSLGFGINSDKKVVGFDEDGTGDGSAWFFDCGTFTGLGTLGGSDAEALALNNAETVTGWAHDASANRKAFTWTSGGGMVDLGTLTGLTDSEGTGINASGEVCGTSLDFGAPPSGWTAFLYLPSAKYGLGAGMNSLGTLGGSFSIAMDLNDSGEVVGGASTAFEFFVPFIWLPSANYGFPAGMNFLGQLGFSNATLIDRAQAINSKGEVVGRSTIAAGDGHAFLWLPNAAYTLGAGMNDLGVLTGGDSSWAFDINESGVVVGTSNVTGGAFHAFVWKNGTMTDLNNEIDVAGWTLNRAISVNDDGFIVGFGENPSGDVHAFLLTPACTAGGGGSAGRILPPSGAVAAFTGEKLPPQDPAQTDATLSELPIPRPCGGVAMIQALTVNFLGFGAFRVRRRHRRTRFDIARRRSVA